MGEIQVVWTKSLDDIFQFSTQIGKGQYGEVWTALDKTRQEMVVCKIVDRKTDYLRELDHLITLRNCQCILPIRKAAISNSKLAMVFNLGETSLYSYIRKRESWNINYILKEAIRVIYYLFLGIYEMHSHMIIHRDVKSGNVVMIQTKPYIIDLGMSKRICIDEENQFRFYEIVTTPYRAPELFEQNEGESLKYNSKIDIWSLGCILYELICQNGPFNANTENEVRRRIAGHCYFQTGVLPRNVWNSNTLPKSVDLFTEILCYLVRFKDENESNEVKLENNQYLNVLRELLEGCLHPDPSKRWSAKKCILKLNKNCQLNHVTLQYPNHRMIYSLEKEVFLEVFKLLFSASDHNQLNPKVIYLGIYNWIRIIGTCPSIMEDYSLFTIMLASIRLSASYCGFRNSDIIKKIRKFIKEDLEKSPKKETYCSSAALTILKGRVYIPNIGEYRIKVGSHVKSSKWDTKLDQLLFSFLVHHLSQRFELPEPNTMINNVIEYINKHI